MFPLFLNSSLTLCKDIEVRNWFNWVLSQMGRRKKIALSFDEAMEFLNHIIQEKSLIPFLIPLILIAWLLRDGFSLFPSGFHSLSRFSDPDRSLNRKRERFKVFEVEPRSNRGRTVMTS